MFHCRAAKFSGSSFAIWCMEFTSQSAASVRLGMALAPPSSKNKLIQACRGCPARFMGLFELVNLLFGAVGGAVDAIVDICVRHALWA